MPAKNVTNCTFGGSDLKTLYISTARMGISEDELNKHPLSGGIFAFNSSVKGKADFKFGV